MLVILELLFALLDLEPTATFPSDYGLFMNHPQRPNNEIHLLPHENLLHAVAFFDEQKRLVKVFDKNIPAMASLPEDLRRHNIALNLTFKIWIVTVEASLGGSTNTLSSQSGLMHVDINNVGPADAWFKNASTSERAFLFALANSDVVLGRFGLGEDAACTIAALHAQIEYGDHFPLVQNFDQGKLMYAYLFFFFMFLFLIAIFSAALDRFFPAKDRPTSPGDTQRILGNISAKWAQLRTRTNVDCMNVYFAHASLWPLFASAWFEATQLFSDKLPQKVLIAIRYNGLFVVDPKTMVTCRS